tara:strand:+ start:15171 stop:16070 length:900 start_codon:yes stop_codon:yes gene_type:complete
VNSIIIGDGGMGSELRYRGIEVPSHTKSIWSALALIEYPQAIKQIHLDYIEAGSEYITINNYSVTRPILQRVGKADQLEDLTLKAIEIAQDAIKESKKEIKIAGSLPPLETSYRADLILNQNAMIDQYKEISEILKDKVDIIICETMSNILETKCALNSVQNSQSQIWTSWTLMGNRENVLPSGENIVDAYKAVSDLRSDAYLINCCGVNLVTKALSSIRELTSKPIGAYANSEIVKIDNQNLDLNKHPEDDHWLTAEEIDEDRYAEEASKWVDIGATVIGGCCRTRPSHIKRLKEIFS